MPSPVPPEVLSLERQARSNVGPLLPSMSTQEALEHAEKVAAEIVRLGRLRRWHDEGRRR